MDCHFQHAHIINSLTSNQRFKFNRLLFGIKVSKDLFHESMNHITSGLYVVISIAYDICIFGKNEKGHDVNMKKIHGKNSGKWVSPVTVL